LINHVTWPKALPWNSKVLMIRGAIILIFLNYCAFLFSQQPDFTAHMECSRKNYPIQIINNHKDYFHVLRYNTDIHDFSLEQRHKPDGRILAFTPFGLDSINAQWFNYENLEYLIYEKGNKLYFLFEKELNTKKMLYLKVIDNKGRASGFIKIAEVEYESSMARFDLIFKRAGDKILAITSREYYDGSSRKTVMCYDPEKRNMVWTRSLPLENLQTGYSVTYELSGSGDLYYVLLNKEISSYERKFINPGQVMVPVYHYNFSTLVRISGDEQITRSRLLGEDLTALNSICIVPGDSSVAVMMHCARPENSERSRVFFVSQFYNKDLSVNIRNKVTPLDARLDKQLTFYDGTDFDLPAAKDYSFRTMLCDSTSCFTLSQRIDGTYYKEMVLWKVNLGSGDVLNQEILPKKTYYYEELAVKASVQCKISDGVFYAFLQEKDANAETNTRDYNYKEFKGGSGGDLICYQISKSGEYKKRSIYVNDYFKWQPVLYQSTLNEWMFYLRKGKLETFATWPLSPF